MTTRQRITSEYFVPIRLTTSRDTERTKDIGHPPNIALNVKLFVGFKFNMSITRARVIFSKFFSITTGILEFDLSAGDDTGLNNIDMACCNVQSPLQNCTPQETWDVVKECDNSHGVTDLSCNYQKRTGIGYAKSAPKSATVTYHNLGFDLGTVGNMLMKHPYSAQSFLPSNFEVTLEETVHSLTFTVLPGYKTEIMQVVGTCGIYSIRTPKFIRSDTNVKNQSDTIFNELGNNGAQLSVLNYEASK